MMDDKLLDDLTQLGLNEQNYRALSVLPLVLVAWADGRVQPAEAATILRIAEDQGLVHAERGRALLERWLAQPPTDAEQHLGLGVLVELARRQAGAGASLDATSMQDLLDLCETVAAAAGSLLGLRDPISATERASIAEIARHLSIDTGQSWQELLQGLESS